MQAMRGLLILIWTIAISGSSKDYTNYKVLRVNVRNQRDAALLFDLREENVYDFWSEIRTDVEIMTSPENFDRLTSWLKRHNMKWSLMISNVQDRIDQEKIASQVNSPSLEMEFDSSFLSYFMDWEGFQSEATILGWLKNVIENYCEYCETEIIGQTFEGRNMTIMKVCKGGCGRKPAMWIDSGIHAREFMGPAVNTWMLNELVNSEEDHPDLLDKLDWYFLPLFNPDGYFRAREKDRMWRKTTSYYPGLRCDGTDANRNWDIHWGGDEGSSNDSCAHTFRGPRPFSEVENRNVAAFLTSHRDQIKFYMTLHSRGQMILLPWGYTKEFVPADYTYSMELAARANKALFNVHGKTYLVGDAARTIYVSTGDSMDWVKQNLSIPYSFAMELRRDWNSGFFTAPSEIIPNGEEVWAFHKEVARRIIKEFGNEQTTRDCNVGQPYRQECGYPGITKAYCEAKGCCYNDKTPNTYWCFK